MKKLFWRTYQAKIGTTDNKMYKIIYFIGFAWEVIKMAQSEAKESSEKDKQIWTLLDLRKL